MSTLDVPPTGPGPHPSVEPTPPIASFVRRSTRMTASQRRAWDTHHTDWVLPVATGEHSLSVVGEPLDLRRTFNREAPLIVEVGSGMGDSLVAMAAARPEADILAFEVYRPAVARTLALLAAGGVENVRLVAADAVEGLRTLLRPGTLEELWVFFPDPWPKLKHRKRRLVDAAFAALAADRLRPEGVWRLATDWADYARQMRAVLDADPAFEALGADALAALPDRPGSHFARRADAAERAVTDLAYLRR